MMQFQIQLMIIFKRPKGVSYLLQFKVNPLPFGSKISLQLSCEEQDQMIIPINKVNNAFGLFICDYDVNCL
ncbi:hypothetical protein BTO06_01225 [Tenacibaculum sp. SZ-18]|uniref:hypothetical protein n=1 Tax=Tenacibaculum sp. SZ-18 TaxID=754423 RepID=UPI000C2D517A|nr:hypothetical protein [Tenacibaculum sp. SZ-18]AUC13855.1 hypothetical protein BTO06_01225 [Tenacibaculum sp. SZ-18]